MMWPRVRTLCVILIVACFAKPILAEELPIYTASMKGGTIPRGNMVLAFEVDVVAGAFDGINNLPVGWSVVVDNDASWQTHIKANSTVGAAGLESEELRKIIFHLRKNEFGDLKFDVSGSVSITKDYEKEEKVRLEMKDFLVKGRR